MKVMPAAVGDQTCGPKVLGQVGSRFAFLLQCALPLWPVQVSWGNGHANLQSLEDHELLVGFEIHHPLAARTLRFWGRRNLMTLSANVRPRTAQIRGGIREFRMHRAFETHTRTHK